MVTQLCSASNKINYHHEGEMHTLIITTRYSGDVVNPVDINILADLTKTTVRVWCEAWSAIKHDKGIEVLHSAQDRLEIADGLLEPYCTVWNLNNNGLTITVNSNEKPDDAVLAAQAQARAIQAIHDSVKGAAKDKPLAIADDNENPTPWRGQEVSVDEAAFPNNANDFSGWEVVSNLPDGAVVLPLKKGGEFGIQGTIPLKYDAVQFEAGKIVTYPFGTIQRSTVGENNLPVISIVTGGYGTLNIFCYKADGDEEKSYDYQKIIDYFARVGIDATAPDFRVEYSATVALKIKHSKDGTKEYKNIYGFWNNPVG